MDIAGGKEVAERVRGAVEQEKPGGVALTISLGVSAAHGEQVEYETLFKAADTALYAAKRSGRNRAVAASSSPNGEREPTRDALPRPPAAGVTLSAAAPAVERA
jgi:predicted signal transduction protein with EAL and GGDEF domain